VPKTDFSAILRLVDGNPDKPVSPSESKAQKPKTGRTSEMNMEASSRLDGSSGPNRTGANSPQGVRQDRQQPQRCIAGDSADVPDGGRLVIEVGETSVGIFRVEGRLYAYLNVCAHMGGPACQGKILPRVLDVIDEDRTMLGQAWDESDPHVVCPWHGFEYSIKTGRHAGRPSIALKSVPVEESGGRVYVTI
jgi:nitrite reductase/ring-hydroxylating ferredoxin subunit